MGDFSKSVKKAISQVFGRGDLEEVLGEEWEFSDSQPLPDAAALEQAEGEAPAAPEAPRHERSSPADLKALSEAAGQESSDSADRPPDPATSAPSSAQEETVPSEENPDRTNAIELPPSETYEDQDELSRAVRLLTDAGPLPESDSFIRELGFGDPHAPYPADLEDASDSEAPARMDTLDITGVFDDFLEAEDDPFDEMDGPLLLQDLAVPPSQGPDDYPENEEDGPGAAAEAGGSVAVEPPAELEPTGDEPVGDPHEAQQGDEEGQEDDPEQEQGATRESQSIPLRLDTADMPLDAFDDSMADSSLDESRGVALTDSGIIEGEAPSVFQSTHGGESTGLPTSATGDEDVAPEGAEDSSRVLSNRGKDLWKRQKARGSSREGPPPEGIWDEPSIRESIARDLLRDIERSKDRNFCAVLGHLRETIEDQPIDLPPFPSAARQLLGTVTEDQVMEIIRSSPSLAGNVVKVANSPYYMSAKPVVSLNAAVMRIGLDQVRRVSLASLVGSSYEVEGFQRVMNRIQLHSIATASAAELISPMTRIGREEAFLGGLLHDAGMVLSYRMVKHANEATGEAWLMDQGTLRRMARKYHQRLGALFLGGWDLAASIASMMAFHHHPDQAEHRYQEHVKLIHIADALAERAVRHSKSPYWKRALASRGPDATEAERSRAADLDGVADIVVHDLLFQAPPSLDVPAMHGVIRSVLLKLDSRRGSGMGGDDGSDTTTS